MTNEWGPPLTGEEMKALKGRIDPGVHIVNAHWERVLESDDWPSSHYHLPANHPYYKVRECNQKNGTNLVLHDGSAKVPDDWDGETALFPLGISTNRAVANNWEWVIAYTPKPKESEVTEQMPSDEAIEYVLRTYCDCTDDEIPNALKLVIEEAGCAYDHARLIQQYESHRLKSAVDVAAEEFVRKWGYEGMDLGLHLSSSFKAGAAWQKENGNG